MDFTEDHINSKLFKKHRDKLKHIKFNVFWDWSDFGISLIFSACTKWSTHVFSIDILILWFNLWIQCIKK